MASKPVIALGVGAGLVGAFFAFRAFQKYQARKQLEALAAQAAAGQIPTRQFLDAALSAGQPSGASGPKITVEDAKRLPCSTVFAGMPTTINGNAIPGFDAAIAQLRAEGRCL